MGGGGGGGGAGGGRRRKKYFSFFHQETCLFPSYLTYTESCTFAACPSPALSMLSMDDPDGPMDCSGADWEPVATPLLVLVPQRSLRTLSLLRDLGVLVPQHVSWKQSLFLFRHRSRHSSSSFSDIWSKTHTHKKLNRDAANFLPRADTTDAWTQSCFCRISTENILKMLRRELIARDLSGWVWLTGARRWEPITAELGERPQESEAGCLRCRGLICTCI